MNTMTMRPTPPLSLARRLGPGPMTRAYRDAMHAIGEPCPDELPETYASECRGDCLAPRFTSGAILAFSTTEALHQGDFVGIWLQPAANPAGGNMRLVKQLLSPVRMLNLFELGRDVGGNAEPLIELGTLNPKRSIFVRMSHVLAMHRVIGTCRRAGDGRAALKRFDEAA